MKVLIKAIIALLFVASSPSMAEIIPPDLRYLKAYATDNCTGASSTFYGSVPDLSKYSLANVINCVCYTGWWSFYSDTNYYDFALAIIGSDQCHQTPNDIMSLRYIGSPVGLNDVYYNLYQDTYYQGVEVSGNTNLESVGELDLDVTEIAIAGQSPWTFYTGLEFTGSSVCVYPSFSYTTDDGFVANWHSYYVTDLGLPDNSIRSVARGCQSTRVARPGPSQVVSQADEHGRIIRMKL